MLFLLTLKYSTNLQIEPTARTYVNESETAYITATLTIPFACKSTEKQCPLFVWFYVPDPFLNDSYSDRCAIMFKNTEQVPVSKDIAVRPKGSDSRNSISREIRVFLASVVPSHEFMNDHFFGVLRIGMFCLLCSFTYININ